MSAALLGAGLGRPAAREPGLRSRLLHRSVAAEATTDQPLDRSTARELAGIVEHSPIAPSSSTRRCTPNDNELAVAVRFRGADPAAADLVEWANCPDLAFVGGTAYRVGATIGQFVSTLPVSHDPGIPGLAGTTFGAASATAHRAGDTLALASTYPDPLAAPGSVLLQSAMDSEIDVVVAVPNAPACRIDQLAVRYRPGAAGAGNDFGTIELTDRSGQWCALRGQLRVAGLDAASAQVTRATTAAANLELSPAATGDGLVGDVLLDAGYRDDLIVPGGLCEPHWVIPVFWRITLPSGSLTVPNAQARVARPIGTGGLITCRGEVQAEVERSGA